MNTTMSNAVAFTIGVATGASVTYILIKNHFKKIADDEIDTMREYFQNKRAEEANALEEEPDEAEVKEARDEHQEDKPNIREYASLIKKENYTNYSDTTADKKKEVDDVEKPYVITPEEFGELDYSTISLTYYSDGVLTYESDELVEDVDDIVGADFAEHFGEYEDDSVFIRNDRMKTDFEILVDKRNYSDVVETNPHSAED